VVVIALAVALATAAAIAIDIVDLCSLCIIKLHEVVD